jgi:hypothetical protein
MNIRYSQREERDQEWGHECIDKNEENGVKSWTLKGWSEWEIHGL